MTWHRRGNILGCTMHFLIIGAGFSGAVLARQLVEGLSCRVTILESRDHLGGNCHTYRDTGTGILIHAYGPHIFNTSHEDVWAFINQYADMRPYQHRVKAYTPRGIFSLPINLHTINQFYNKTFTPEEARAFLATLGDRSITEPRNFEEQALRFLGKDLYETFFRGYTIKQWGCDPKELPASILKRLPVRFDYEDNYHRSRYTAIPASGYTAIMEKLIDHPAIEVNLNTSWNRSKTTDVDHVFYTGPIDAFYDYCFGRLSYRTVTFERIEAAGDYQGCAQMNYTGLEVRHTRITEHKYFAPWQKYENTVAFREYSKETTPADVPYYPKRMPADKAMLAEYEKQAGHEANVTFLGRLATYRYLDMDQVIGEALDVAAATLQAARSGDRIPPFGSQRTK